MNQQEIEKTIEGVKPTLSDRVVGYFSPERGVKRRKARVAMALAGAYTGASKKRRATTNWATSSGDADADTLWDLPTLRERSSDLVRNNPLGGGVLNTKVAGVVGSGLRLNARIDAEFLGMSDDEADLWERNTEREFRMWADSPNCDVARTLNFYEQQALAFRTTLEKGDTLLLMTYVDRESQPYSLALQLIEAERISNENFQKDSATLAGGVEKDEHGAPIRYHISKQHPGNDRYKKQEWDKVDAFGETTGRRNVLHLYRKLRPGQTRGVPVLAPVIEMLKQLGDFTDAYLNDAVISSMFTAFLHTEGDYQLEEIAAFNREFGSSKEGELKMGSGNIVGLGVNEKVEFANPARPNQAFDGFILALARQLGTAVELPYEILMQQFNSSYSASKAAIEQVWNFFRRDRKWLSDGICHPVYEAWMYESVALGRISAPGFMRDPAIRAAYLGSEWIGPSKPVLDLSKEASGRALMEDRGWNTAAQNTIELTGGDWDRNHRQRTKEHRKRVDADLEPKITVVGVDKEPDDPSDSDKQDNE